MLAPWSPPKMNEAPTSTIGQATLVSLSFSCFFFDYDLDGRPDIFAANGHVADDISRVQKKYPLTRTATVAVGPLTELAAPT